MLTYNRHEIQRDIDYYFRQHALTDMIVFGNNFIQMCPYTIWKSVLGHAEFDRNSIAPDNSIEELLEKIKELTGEHVLKMETSCGLFYIVSLTLANGMWYLHKCPGGYDSRPMWKLGTTRGSMLSAQDAAELILEFDRYIPQILERAEAAVLERKEKKIGTAHPTGARVRICTAAGDFIALGEVREFENGTAIKGIKYFDV